MKGVRIERVQEEIRRELGEILRTKVRDPRLGWVTVVRVEVSADLGYARVFISTLGDDASQEASLRVLAHAAPFLRTELGRRLELRKSPELRFRADQGLANSLRIQEVLRELGFTETGSGPAAEDEE